MYGLFFSSFAILFFLRYLRRGKARNAILSVVMLSLAYWVRSNNIILIIALSGILILLTLREKRYRYLLLVLAFFAFPMSLHKATTSYYEITTHQKIPGTPQIAWLAMAYRTNPILNACQDGIPAMSVTFTPRKRGISKELKKC